MGLYASKGPSNLGSMAPEHCMPAPGRMAPEHYASPELYASWSRNYPARPSTAQSQTIVTSGAAAEPNPYFDVETLLASVESGAIAAVKGTWLVGLHKRGGRLSRRQDLPPEAFWSAGELKRVALALGDDFGVLFVALSYRWLTKEHPDPDGFHLGIVAAVAELYLNLKGGKWPWEDYGKAYGHDFGPNEFPSQLTAAFRKHGLGLPEFALFWDFASLHQPPRTDAEAKLFPKGLQNSNVWYGHARTVVWMQSQLPEGFAARMRASKPPLAETYEDSGWCYVEAAISAAIKPGFLRLDLAERTEQAMACAYGPEKPGSPDFKLACVCARRRPPPPSPEAVRRLLQTEKRFTNSSDVSKVADLYATFFGKVTNVDTLVFQGLEWGNADVVKLCEVLPRFAAVRTLDLSENYIRPEGASALGEALKVNAVLKNCNLLKNSLDVELATMLAKIGREKGVMLSGMKRDQTKADFSSQSLQPADAILIGSDLQFMAVLTTLILWQNSIGDEGAKAIAEALKVNTVVTFLDLSFNKIGAEGAIAIAEALKVNAVVTTLSLGNNNKIGAEGAIAIAEALKVNAVLTTLRLSSNNIGPEGAITIEEALKVKGGLTALNLSSNSLKDEGVNAVCEAIQSNKETKLASLNFSYNSISPVGANAVAAMVAVTGALTSVDLRGNKLGDEGWGAIFAAICGNKDSKIIAMDASSENIGPAGVKLIAEALRTSVTGALTSLDLSSNRLCGLDNYGFGTYTAEGITAIADALRVNGGLTILNLSSNNLCSVTETGYIKASQVQGSSFNEGDKVVYQGKEMIVSKAKDRDGDIKMTNLPDMSGLNALADAFRVNGRLTELNIAGNSIKDEGITAICNAVQGNKESKLAKLNVAGNNISPVGATAVAAMLVAITGGP